VPELVAARLNLSTSMCGVFSLPLLSDYFTRLQQHNHNIFLYLPYNYNYNNNNNLPIASIMSNWLDRLNINSAPGQSPPVSRPYSPVPASRNSLQLPATRSQQPIRPSLQTRSTSLNLLSTISLPAAARVPSSLKHQLSQVPEVDVVDPFLALETILGISLKKPDVTLDALANIPAKPENLVDNIDFGDLSLQDFIEQNAPRHAQRVSIHNVQSVAECMSAHSDFHLSFTHSCTPQMKQNETDLRNCTRLSPYVL